MKPVRKSLQIDKLISDLKKALENHPSIVFAYLHGSSLRSENPRDVDIAVYLAAEAFDKLVADAEVSLSFAIPLEMALETLLKRDVDVQVINRAPLSFRYHAIKNGKVLVDNDSDKRCDFEYLTMVEYFDFNPRHKEYLKEVLS